MPKTQRSFSLSSKFKTENRKPNNPLRKSMTPANLSELTIPELRAKKQESIQQLDFEKSDLIESIIKSIQCDNSNQIFRKSEEQLDRELKEIFNEHESLFAAEQESFLSLLIELRKEISENFNSLQQIHIEEIISLRIEKKLDLKWETMRPFTEKDDFENRARTCAKANQFEEAIALRNLATELKLAEHERRNEEINKSFRKKFVNLSELQAKDLQFLTDKLVSGEEKLTRSFEKMKTSLLGARLTKAKLAFRTILKSGKKELLHPSKKPEYKQKLTCSFNQKMNDLILDESLILKEE